MAQSQSPSRVGVLAIIGLMIALALPGFIVSYLLRPDAVSGSGLPIGVIVGVILVLLVVGTGMAAFFSRRGVGNGNVRAAILALIAAGLFGAFTLVAAERSVDGNAEAISTPSH